MNEDAFTILQLPNGKYRPSKVVELIQIIGSRILAAGIKIDSSDMNLLTAHFLESIAIQFKISRMKTPFINERFGAVVFLSQRAAENLIPA